MVSPQVLTHDFPLSHYEIHVVTKIKLFRLKNLRLYSQSM